MPTPEQVEQNLLTYYKNLLIIQYRTKPKAQQTMALMFNQALCDGLPFALARCFDLNTAIGAQLDVLGRIVGVPRIVFGLDLAHTFFSFIRYNDTTARPGFGRYNDNPYTTSIWYRYIIDAKSIMSDFQMVSVIKLKIIQNNSYTNLKDISEALWRVFGVNITVVDNKNMTVTYSSTVDYGPILIIANFLNILPKPMGVAISIV